MSTRGWQGCVDQDHAISLSTLTFLMTAQKTMKMPSVIKKVNCVNSSSRGRGDSILEQCFILSGVPSSGPSPLEEPSRTLGQSNLSSIAVPSFSMMTDCCLPSNWAAERSFSRLVWNQEHTRGPCSSAWSTTQKTSRKLTCLFRTWLKMLHNWDTFYKLDSICSLFPKNNSRPNSRIVVSTSGLHRLTMSTSLFCL